MKLTKVERTQIEEVKEYPGLLDLILKHEIKSTAAAAQYNGPLIPPETWREVLAFFKYVQDDSHSEAQVRLFVNPDQQTWRAWAFPQEAQTGMSAKELDTEATRVQRAAFSDSEGWLYFGTVHHHCNCTAFQSGTDEFNEKSQDGLHITIGKMEEKQYDMHARFYVAGMKLCFDPDMSEFWDIGDQLKTLTPADLHDKIARHQMTVPPTDQRFPDIWKENLIVKKVEPPKSYPVGNGVGGDYYRNTNLWSDYSMSLYQRAERANDMLIDEYKKIGLMAVDVLADVQACEDLFAYNGDFGLIKRALNAHRLQLGDLDELMRDLRYLRCRGWDRKGEIRLVEDTDGEDNHRAVVETIKKDLDDKKLTIKEAQEALREYYGDLGAME